MFLQILKTILQSNKFLIFLSVITIFLVILAFLIPKDSVYSLNTEEINGTINSFKIDGNMLRIDMKAKEKITAFYYFDSEEEKNRIASSIGYGYKVTLVGELAYPDGNSIPNTFNYQKYLYYHDVYLIMNVTKINISSTNNVWQNVKTNIYRYLLRFENSDFLLAFLLGNTSNLELEQIRDNGISHLFAVSGMHISLFALVLRKMLRKFGSKKDLIISLLLIFYAFLVGFTPSVLRSSLLFILISLNSYFDLKLSNKRLFLYLFLALLIYNPFYLMDMGFQYSFAICFTFLFLKSSKGYFFNLLKTSLLAFTISLPITAMNFYEINILSVIWNLFFVPYVTFILYPACFIVIFFPFLSAIFSIILEVFNLVNSWCANIKIGVIIIPYIASFIWIIYYFLIALFLKFKQKKYVLLIMTFLLIVKIYPKINLNSFIYFLDVGQGDAAVFISPWQKEVIMIDTGGIMNYNNESWQERKNKISQSETIKTFLNSKGISKIDLLILTHGDYDHMGNAQELVNKLTVRKIMLNKNNFNNLESDLFKKYSNKIVFLYEPVFFKWTMFYNQSKAENNASLIFKINVYSKTFLMMGDASKNEEKELLKENILSDVIKIGHHGSNTSSDKTFLKTVNPEYAIISVGRNNRYNHPSKETLKTLNELNIPYFLTSEKNTLWFKVSKKALKLYTLN